MFSKNLRILILAINKKNCKRLSIKPTEEIKVGLTKEMTNKTSGTMRIDKLQKYLLL